jgi:hypothetical protein
MTKGIYTQFKGKRIADFNIGGKTEYGSLEECKTACTNNTKCLSFDKTSGPASKVTCYMGLVTYDMMNSVDPTQIKNDNQNYDLYSKTCS